MLTSRIVVQDKQNKNWHLQADLHESLKLNY